MIPTPRRLLVVLALALLGGCATQAGRSPDYVPQQGGPGYGPLGPEGKDAVPGSPSTGGSASAGATGSAQGQRGMCDLHHQVMAARTREERQALLDQTMHGMSPEMRERHMQMMWERCR